MTIANAIMLLGGLGFFLFGMSLLGDGLKKVAGSKLEIILAKLTSTTFKGVLLGTLVTAVIQSSSATTVMVVGFVNSGIMQLANAIGIIMGANIGTTATGWILVLAGVEGKGAFSSATMFALISFIGILLYFFCKKPKQKNIGLIMLAFSVLMSGMQSMSGAMAPLKESKFFLDFITAVSNPFVSMLVGIIVTAIIQSCSASIGILQALSITGVIGYDVAIPMVLGMCIGACVPVLVSAIGANINGKRAAFVYLYFNIAGSIILMIPFYIIHAIVGFEFMDVTATSMGIAVVNTVYKVLATAIQTPFAGVLEKLAVTTIKDKKTDEDDEYEDNLLDERFLEYPPLALEQSGKTMHQMSDAAFKNFTKSIELLSVFSQEKYDKVMRREERVDKYEDRLGSYMVRLHKQQLSDEETETSAKYLAFLGNVERISDHAVNIAELAQELYSKKISFSPRAVKELEICIDAVREITELTKRAMQENDVDAARKVEPLEEVIDVLTKELKGYHVQRVQAGQCTLELGFIFNDCINNLERVSDHCSNIAVAVLEAEAQNTHLYAHNYQLTLNQSNQEQFREQFNVYAKKYYDALSEQE
ncbi:MAG: Na/Pi cotransporter family protein [Oscillospiraceae bacterium]|nr:Na/Pi cotransporter family protein [Oscillospiraceae bacterium]